jgi:serum/glucocorticoid-regulated kinase 2
MDTTNFDTEFTTEAPQDSLCEGSNLSDAVQQQFQGFTFQQTEAIAGSITSGSLMGQGTLAPPQGIRQAGGMRR